MDEADDAVVIHKMAEAAARERAMKRYMGLPLDVLLQEQVIARKQALTPTGMPMTHDDVMACEVLMDLIEKERQSNP